MFKPTAMILMTLTGCMLVASADAQPSSKNPKSLKAPTVEAKSDAPSKTIKPTGPLGFGPINFDITKDRLEALAKSDDVYLDAPLTIKDMKAAGAKDDTIWYEGKLHIPQSSTLVPATFVFKDGKLTYFSIEPHEITLDYMQKEISNKYGPGEVDDNQKEEQCVYKNGSNFKLVNGTKSTKWYQTVSATEKVSTSVSDMQFAMCPSSLRDPMFSTKHKTISFSLILNNPEPKKSMF